MGAPYRLGWVGLVSAQNLTSEKMFTHLLEGFLGLRSSRIDTCPAGGSADAPVR